MWRRVEASCSSLAVQSRVVSALVMREFRHRAAHSRFGLLTVFIPVALNIATLGVVLSVFNHGRAPIGDHLFFFYATGVMPFYLFLHVIDHSQNLFLDSTNILQIPIITRLDLVLAAAIAEVLIMTAAVVMTFGVFCADVVRPAVGQSDRMRLRHDGGLAVCLRLRPHLCGHDESLSSLENGWLIVQRFLYFLSGVFFIPLNMPVVGSRATLLESAPSGHRVVSHRLLHAL